MRDYLVVSHNFCTFASQLENQLLISKFHLKYGTE